MKWEIKFFSEKVRQDVLSLPEGILAKFISISQLMKIEGPNLGGPYTKAMGNGLFEIRAKGKEGIGRVFYCVLINKHIIILHSFVKKSQKTPKKELDIAKKRMKEVFHDNKEK